MSRCLYEQAKSLANRAADLRKFGTAARNWEEAANYAADGYTRQTCLENAERYRIKARNAIASDQPWCAE